MACADVSECSKLLKLGNCFCSPRKSSSRSNVNINNQSKETNSSLTTSGLFLRCFEGKMDDLGLFKKEVVPCVPFSMPALEACSLKVEFPSKSLCSGMIHLNWPPFNLI